MTPQFPIPRLLRVAPAILAAAIFATYSATAAELLENPDFENGLTGWTVTPAGAPAFQVTAEAASMGKTGLRILPAETPSHLYSKRFPASPGQIFRFTAWMCPNGSRVASIALEFYDAQGKVLAPVNTPGFWPSSVPKNEGQFNMTVLQAAAPQDAASVAVHIQAPRSKDGPSLDIDDCSFVELTPEAASRQAPPPPIPVDALLAEIKSNPTRGKKPPMIVLKLDDYGLSGLSKGPEKVKDPGHQWRRVGEFATKRHIKMGFGILAKSLEVCGDPFIEWMKTMHATGLVEFWFHGYDHAGWKNDKGVECSEFFGRSVEEQKQRFAQSQQLMAQKVGFPLLSFGPPGGPKDPHFDAATIEAIQDDPHMKAWMYPQPLDPAGAALMAKGKVAVLGRVWSVNLESVVGHAQFDTFLQGYAHNRGRTYFVLQGHPPLWGWGDDRFNEFFKIVDFLESQGAQFVTPSECGEAVLKAKVP